MDYIKLIIFDGVFGYLLQGVSYTLSLYAFCKKKIKANMFIFVIILSAILMYIIRNIDIINFGIHTLLFMIVMMLISVFILKFPINKTVLAVLLAAVTTTVSEVLNVIILRSLFSEEKVNDLLRNSDDIGHKIDKAIAGIPTNVILVSVMLLIYYINIKNIKLFSVNSFKLRGNSNFKLIDTEQKKGVNSGENSTEIS